MTGKQLTPTQQKVKRLNGVLARYAPTYESVLGKPEVVERMQKLALIAATRIPALLDCDPNTIATSVLRAAQLGLDIGTTCHVLPFGKVAQLVVDYRGYVELMIDSGGVHRVEARCVYEDEVEAGQFSIEYGTNPHVYHKPILRSRMNDDGTHEEAVAAYCVAFYRNGENKFEVMTHAELEAARDGKGGPWTNQWRPEMEKKTVLRRLAKTIPQSPKLRAAFEVETRNEGWKASPNELLDDPALTEVEAVVVDE